MSIFFCRTAKNGAFIWLSYSEFLFRVWSYNTAYAPAREAWIVSHYSVLLVNRLNKNFVSWCFCCFQRISFSEFITFACVKWKLRIQNCWQEPINQAKTAFVLQNSFKTDLHVTGNGKQMITTYFSLKNDHLTWWRGSR